MVLHFNEGINIIIKPGEFKPQNPLVAKRNTFKSSFKGSRKIFSQKTKKEKEILQNKNVT